MENHANILRNVLVRYMRDLKPEESKYWKFGAEPALSLLFLDAYKLAWLEYAFRWKNQDIAECDNHDLLRAWYSSLIQPLRTQINNLMAAGVASTVNNSHVVVFLLEHFAMFKLDFGNWVIELLQAISDECGRFALKLFTYRRVAEELTMAENSISEESSLRVLQAAIGASRYLQSFETAEAYLEETTLAMKVEFERVDGVIDFAFEISGLIEMIFGKIPFKRPSLGKLYDACMESQLKETQADVSSCMEIEKNSVPNPKTYQCHHYHIVKTALSELKHVYCWPIVSILLEDDLIRFQDLQTDMKQNGESMYSVLTLNKWETSPVDRRTQMMIFKNDLFSLSQLDADNFVPCPPDPEIHCLSQILPKSSKE